MSGTSDRESEKEQVERALGHLAEVAQFSPCADGFTKMEAVVPDADVEACMAIVRHFVSRARRRDDA